MWYNIQDFEYLISDMIFDSSTSVNFVAIKINKIADLSYVMYAYSIEDLNRRMWIWYLPHMAKCTG